MIIIGINTILETSLAHPGKDNIYTTKADSIAFSVKASLPRDSGGGDDDDSMTTYSNIDYDWSFTPQDGNTSEGKRTFTKLKQGEKNTLLAQVSVTCKKTVKKRKKIPITTETGIEIGTEWSDWEKDEEESTSNYLIGTGSASIDVYTRPGDFSEFNFTKDTIIQSPEGLTKTKVDNWCTHCGKYLSWKYQADKYNSINHPPYTVNSNDIITAHWYNSCARICELISEEDDDLVYSKITLITAEIIKKLGTQISKSDS